MKRANQFPLYGWLGCALILFMHSAILLSLHNITTWATPVFWTGFILICDALLYTQSAKSIIQSKAIIPLAIISIVTWWVFEWFNLFLSNWHYINLGDSILEIYIGYFWAFATIIPGVLLVYSLLLKVVHIQNRKGFSVSRSTLVWMFCLGLLFLAIPIIPFSMYYINRGADVTLFIWLEWAADTYLSEFTAAFVWTGFVLILEPLNYSMGNRSILRFASQGNYRPLLVLTLAGIACGFLWEFWNYWAYTKWYYTIPVIGHLKFFEMPLLGYLGFIPFAWELYAMVSLLYPKGLEILEGDA